MSRKVFTAGEVLAAADVNSFLMDQTVMSFAGTAARGSAIGTATEGMVTYLEDIDDLRIYNGSSWVSPYGLTLIETLSPSAVTSVSFSAGAFNSTYDNYRIVATLDGINSSPQNISIRLRAAGTDNTSSQYQYMRHGIVGGANFVQGPGTTTSFVDICSGNPLSTSNFQIDVISPFLTSKTRIQGLTLQTQSTDLFNIHYAGQMTVTTSYDSLTIFSNSNISGKIRLYGYRN